MKQLEHKNGCLQILTARLVGPGLIWLRLRRLVVAQDWQQGKTGTM